MVVFDITRKATFDAVRDWKRELDYALELDLEENARKIPVILLANKCDLLTSPEAAVELGVQLEQVKRELNFAAAFITSAKLRTRVEEAMQFVVDRLVHNDAVAAEQEAAAAAALLAQQQEMQYHQQQQQQMYGEEEEFEERGNGGIDLEAPAPKVQRSWC